MNPDIKRLRDTVAIALRLVRQQERIEKELNQWIEQHTKSTCKS